MSNTAEVIPKIQADVTQTAHHHHYGRYPGPRSFADDEVDRRLFFGREQEIDDLLHRVRASRLLVLFGKSGLGKTSLLQAGLYPHLRERNLLPVPVRFNQPDVEPVRAVFEALRVMCHTHGIDYDPRETEGLWEFFKSTDFWRGEVLQTPVLVFDQFEELFTLQSQETRAALVSALGELVSRGVPTRIRERLQLGERVKYTDTPPEVKVILSLREEFVIALEQLMHDVPAIFERRVRLAPLSGEVARRAVVEPAALDDPAIFTTKPFRYTTHTLDAIMEFLVNRQGEVEPFQLQIVCRHVDQQVARRQAQGDLNVEVDNSVLGGRQAMEALLENFYRNVLRELPAWSFSRQRSRARRLCEIGLLSPNGHRVSIEQGQIRKQYKIRERSLERLTEARLLRKETRPGLEGFYYELSHDSLTGPVMKGRRLRQIGMKVTLGIVVFLAATSTASTWIWWKGFTIDQARLKVQSIFVNIYVEPDGMLPIAGGTFRQGDIHGIGQSYAWPVREVTIQKFAIGRYEVTFEEYDPFAIATGPELPGDQGWGRGRQPVINVSWEDARDYAAWLSDKTGKRFRLPTESEWEYAARSRDTDEVWAGTSDEEQLKEYAVYFTKSQNRTALVGGKKPNGLGLYDMSGNVWEWVEDCLHPTYIGAPTDGSAWLEADGGDCGQRLLRGGSWGNVPGDLRSSNRSMGKAVGRNYLIGFRLAQDMD